MKVACLAVACVPTRHMDKVNTQVEEQLFMVTEKWSQYESKNNGEGHSSTELTISLRRPLTSFRRGQGKKAGTNVGNFEA
jgi:hypothetical protein